MAYTSAYKFWINEIVGARIDDVERCIEVKGIKVKKARVMGTVVKVYRSQTSEYAFLTIDDGTAQIRVKIFGDEAKQIEKWKIGDIVDVIGRVRFKNSEIYLVPEILIRVKDPNWELLRKLQLLWLGKLREGGKVQVEEEIIGDLNLKVIRAIKELDDGTGAEVGVIARKVGIKPEECETIIKELLIRGEIYEPKPKRYKVL
ncbi:MAG: OB-fold nucleic acid binding domain-containing protein [Candidatus Nanoarchaeia archaeon]|nr:OB-fold nucleic acid binding domain-containing protein [Candidatus Haiyanarchaeum thermophilum]MCW1303145.1 OB-fold nucleic acid binding domain-containing protein [Candidatus Haiyanarchaeum thermophilum]MCW1303810.1 OB-fold nucleic acid binding domain-containing protein [Candidatus Haiyanarchaeum thermophilum]MCW1306574.1 OB-fold nucleic acid binding domain-containing protein [Candidatus Haiyanarchaeum thermophilum]MCW1306987.1 OB-fold nucleic acid binding domain-containing protein [Candidat